MPVLGSGRTGIAPMPFCEVGEADVVVVVVVVAEAVDFTKVPCFDPISTIAQRPVP